jgi:hypothetical protein
MLSKTNTPIRRPWPCVLCSAVSGRGLLTRCRSATPVAAASNPRKSAFPRPSDDRRQAWPSVRPIETTKSENYGSRIAEPDGAKPPAGRRNVCKQANGRPRGPESMAPSAASAWAFSSLGWAVVRIWGPYIQVSSPTLPSPKAARQNSGASATLGERGGETYVSPDAIKIRTRQTERKIVRYLY